MAPRTSKETLQLGFLSAISLDDGGFVGGLLITNQHGRPLEFQCTTPVRPNRTQQILYGPTLEPYLLGEVIGRTLIERAQVKPDVILTGQSEMLELRRHIETPVALCLSDDSDDGAAADGSEMTANVGSQILRFHSDHADDNHAFAQHWKSIPANADLTEPFERVKEALGETVKTSRP